jgi:hypothetical protein
MGIQLDFSGKHGPKIANRHEPLLGGFSILGEPLCIFMRFCEPMI